MIEYGVSGLQLPLKLVSQTFSMRLAGKVNACYRVHPERNSLSTNLYFGACIYTLCTPPYPFISLFHICNVRFSFIILLLAMSFGDIYRFCPPMHDCLRKQSSQLVVPPFLALKDIWSQVGSCWLCKCFY